ncbi:hypothetical protein ARMGADRAFT_229737 [Armillaria gallica]|uniref:Protein kinase domain-containing protein n=1 Tax=Armillaria gallica TaxID=47427 RepID=A0A2H3E2Y5_ARMGA|nr:hypothetical protein ARMGADRAFT_229737 [Armillaria gallica]
MTFTSVALSTRTSSPIISSSTLHCRMRTSVCFSSQTLRDGIRQRHPMIVLFMQPLPLPTIEEFAKRTFILGDLGSAQPSGQRITDHICPESLRPSEIYIGGPWDEKVDIWSFGCLIRLWFVVFFQMIAHTREVFLAKQLSASPLAGYYFNETCRLKKKPGHYLYQTEHWVVRSSDGDISMDKAKEVLRFMRRYLRLDPADRASAKE